MRSIPPQIEDALAETAPKIRSLADVEILPTDGLTYYKLKNFGIARATTGISVMLDSDAAPQPGWLENLLAPFADPEIMAVGGFTVLGYEDFLSKTMALSWIFNLPEERDKTVKRAKIHANNCAVRTDFFREHPFPDLPAFKKQCGFWLRDLDARGHQLCADRRSDDRPCPPPRLSSSSCGAAGPWASTAITRRSRPSPARASAASATLSPSSARRSANPGTGSRPRARRVALPVWQRPMAMAHLLRLLRDRPGRRDQERANPRLRAASKAASTSGESAETGVVVRRCCALAGKPKQRLPEAADHQPAPW